MIYFLVQIPSANHDDRHFYSAPPPTIKKLPTALYGIFIVLAGVLEGSICGTPFFLKYINDLNNNFSSTAKLFADDTTTFFIIHNFGSSTKQLNDDLKRFQFGPISGMYFNLALTKQAQEVMFSRKSSRVDLSAVTFNNYTVARTPCQKHLGLYFEEKLNISHHIEEKISKACKGITLIRRLHYFLPKPSLLKNL